MSKDQAERILRKVEEELPEKADSFPSLTGKFAGLKKFRVGNYRVIYTIIEETRRGPKTIELNLKDYPMRSAKARGLLIGSKPVTKITHLRYLTEEELTAKEQEQEDAAIETGAVIIQEPEEQVAEVIPEKAEVKPEEKEIPEPEIEAEPEEKPKPKAKAKVEPKIEEKPEPKVKAKSKPKAKAEPKIEEKPETKAKTKPEKKEKPKPEPKAEAKEKPKAEKKSDDDDEDKGDGNDGEENEWGIIQPEFGF